MSKKSKKSTQTTAAPAAQGDSFFEGQAPANGAAVATVPAAAETSATKARRTYKPRSKTAGPVKSAGKAAARAAWQAGFKAGVAFSEMGA